MEGGKQVKIVSSLLLHPTPHWREGLHVSDLGEARNSLSSVWHDITSDQCTELHVSSFAQ